MGFIFPNIPITFSQKIAQTLLYGPLTVSWNVYVELVKQWRVECDGMLITPLCALTHRLKAQPTPASQNWRDR